MLYVADIEAEYQLRRKNNPDESEEESRAFVFKRAMEAGIDEAQREIDEKFRAYERIPSVTGLRRNIR